MSREVAKESTSPKKVQSEDLKSFLELPVASIDQIIHLVEAGLRAGLVDISTKDGRSSLSFNDDLLRDVKIQDTTKEDLVKHIASIFRISSVLVHTPKSVDEVDAQLFELPKHLDSKVKFMFNGLLKTGMIKEIDYIYHAETPRLYFPGLHGTPKLRKLGSPLNKGLYPCTDITIMLGDEEGQHPFHFEANLRDLNVLIEKLIDIRKKTEEVSDLGAKLQ